MSTKNTIVSVGEAKQKKVSALVSKLNAAFTAMPTFEYSSTKEAKKREKYDTKKFNLLSEEFCSILAQIHALGAEVKYCLSGFYYPKYDAQGRDLFVVQVEKKITTQTFIAAPSEQEALAEARRWYNASTNSPKGDSASSVTTFDYANWSRNR